MQLEDLINAGNSSRDGILIFNGLNVKNSSPDSDQKRLQVSIDGFADSNIKLDTKEFKQKLRELERREDYIEFSNSGMESPALEMKLPSPTRKHGTDYQSTGIGSTKDASGLRSKITLKTAGSENSQRLFAGESRGTTDINV